MKFEGGDFAELELFCKGLGVAVEVDKYVDADEFAFYFWAYIGCGVVMFLGIFIVGDGIENFGFLA